MKAPKVKATLFGSHTLGWRWELPADAASYERMVRQVGRAIWKRSVMGCNPKWRNSYKPDAIAALKAIGITPPKKGRK